MVVNKPHGVLSHPNPKDDPAAPPRCAFEGRYNFDTKCFHAPAGVVWLIHRLDQDTSGVLLAAKDAKSAMACRRAFEEDQVRKTYLALTVGGGFKPEGVWQDHLATLRQKNKVRTTVDKTRRPNAEARFKLLGYSPVHRLSYLEVALVTGKTHQIRVQAASRQHPILGDDVYGNFDLNRKLRKELGIKRLFLHAAQLQVAHPATGKVVTVDAPLPQALSAVLAASGIVEKASGN
ncbi:MAG: rRNA pseudouridine synthase, partial [Verrucomicrobiaceae bacterium]|nr:rRNA pseudouridine synthase [Verrucomicrobiaceae bacterium]